ncbi:hypothetical protein [Alicyclobacillus ferrooxydans]|uniref:hypothetical protein n=1 Tax=Alicyclobacillus ferrooxydans TaxID=471514 RepID=UPI001B8071B4|nr:hypothetical protein [Alicyclobacillus ferrooxydans]
MSGATMTRHLFGADYAKFPLGRLVKESPRESADASAREFTDESIGPQLNRIGLINVCNVPLQSSAYQNQSLVQTHQVWFDAMSAVRTDNQRDRASNPYCQAVQSILVSSLRDKLESLKDRPCTIVPCGRFAQKFFRLTGQESSNWNVIHDVPHPSYNSWDRPRYQSVIDAVSSALSSADGP